MKSCAQLCVLVLLAAAALPGQQLTSLNGTVTDPTGASLPGAVIVLENLERGGRRETASDIAGRYSFPQIQPDNYRITAKAQGFSDVVINDVRLLVNTPTTINIDFQKVGAVAETVAVTADIPLVSTVDASLGNAIGSQAILQLPFFARNVAGLLAFQPGVTAFNTSTTNYLNGSVNGGKSDQANVTLDGIDVNDQQERYAFTSVLRVTLDSVQEFRTTTTGANAEAGRSSGAQIALVTKNGTNNLHGSLYEYHRNTVHSANDFFNTLSDVKRPALLINVFGGSVGGPIKRDKAFFFLNYEGRRDASAQNVARTVPSDELRQGIVQYRNTAGGTSRIGPAEIRAIDPRGIGVNQAALQVFQSYPKPNDFTLGDGLNRVGYRFTAPIRGKQDTYTARFDYNLSSNHTLFWRGNLQNDRSNGPPQFPGDPPATVSLVNAKGYGVGHTALLTPTLVSTFRYGLTRQSLETTGVQTASAVSFRGLDDRFALTRGTARAIPVHHITQDFAWTRGAHDVRIGGTLRWTSNASASFSQSFHSASTNVSWLRGTGVDLQTGLDLHSTGRTAYNDAIMAVTGIISQGNARYNFNIDGSVLSVGAPVRRKFKNEEYEMYGQDTWKLTRALTLTYGLRYSLMPPVYEANGVQTSAADLSIGEWFNRRAGLAQQGRSQAEAGLITYVLHNDPRGRPLYAFHKKNFAPRVSLAYSPMATDGWRRWLFGGPGRTTIRAGWGMFYDLFGQPLVRTFDASAFGLATGLTNPSSQVTSITAPRFTGIYNLPSELIRAAPRGGFPVQHPTSGSGSFAITNSIDDTLRPPYTMNMNLSVGREFRGGLFIQGSYVGRQSRRSLITRDLAMPTNLKDPASGQTYFEAATQMVLLRRARTPVSQIPRVPFWENMYPGAAGSGRTASQNIYQVFGSYPNDETGVLFDIDTLPPDPACSRLGCNAMFSSQFSALAALSSVAGGNYHAMQWTMRKRFGQGLLLDFNYTWSKSVDMSSTRERDGAYAGFLLNPFSPDQRVAVSDYDAQHLYNALGVWELPFGRGKRYGSNAGRALNAVIGGWQVTGTWSQSTELPVSVQNGRNWPTNWNIFGFATPVGTPPASTKTKNAPAVAGRPGPNMYANPTAALRTWDFTLPGQSGSRNTLRIDGGFNINTGVGKRFIMPYNESHSVQFRWEIFNLPNAVRFDTVNLSLGDANSFGKYTSTLNRPREMQFALRYEF